MNESKFTLKYLAGNKRVVAIFSVLVAFVIWLSVVINQTPTIEKTISLPININTQGTLAGETGLKEISGALERNVTVRVKGSAYIVSNLTSDDIEVIPSLNAITVPGEYSVTLNATKKTLNGDYSIISVTPSEISTRFDYVTEATYNVAIKADGIKLSPGLADSGLIDRGLRFNNPGEDTVKISGPKTETDKIHSVVAYVSEVGEISKTTDYDAQIVLLDSRGNELDKKNYTLSHTSVKVSKVIYKKKTVSVKATFSGAPSGFTDNVKWKLSDSQIEIMGEPETIASISKIELPAIDVTNISLDNNSVVMPLEFMGGIESVDNTTSITVTFDMSRFAEKSFTVTNIVTKNNSSNLTATLSSAIKNVKICGPASIINNLKASDLCAEIDVSGKTAGEYIVPVTIKSSSGKTLWQVGTYEASVKMK